MKLRYFIGVDVAKATFTYTLLKDGVLKAQGLVSNEKKDIRLWFVQLKAEFPLGGKNTLFCIEHTGIYSKFLLEVLSVRKCNIWYEAPLQIKRSLGLQRGKNDKVDSSRIAQYAYQNKEKVRLWSQPRIEIQKLKDLTSLRKRMQKVAMDLQKRLNEQKKFKTAVLAKEITDLYKKSITQLNVDLKNTNRTITSIVDSDPTLNRLYKIVTSVPGIGEITAIELIICTDEFKRFPTSRKFACYCGIAPFEHSSGTSVKGKTKVSFIANRKMKAFLHFPALTVIYRQTELQEYYKRKVAEGHPKLSVLNAVKNKIVHRVFACVRDNRLYETKRSAVAADFKQTEVEIEHSSISDIATSL